MMREHRILAVAIIFFLIGVFFYFTDKERGMEKIENNGKPMQLQTGQSFMDPLLAKYPEPSKFQKISPDKREISAECRDTYLTILIFPADTDYRNDITKAVFNKAFPCIKEELFHYNLGKDFKDGNYYVIAADQGTEGTWYNPR